MHIDDFFSKEGWIDFTLWNGLYKSSIINLNKLNENVIKYLIGLNIKFEKKIVNQLMKITFQTHPVIIC